MVKNKIAVVKVVCILYCHIVYKDYKIVYYTVCCAYRQFLYIILNYGARNLFVCGTYPHWKFGRYYAAGYQDIG